MLHRIRTGIFVVVLSIACTLAPPGQAEVTNRFSSLQPGAVRFNGFFQDHIQNSIEHWNKGVVPYEGFVQMFRTGRVMFAQGEMWGKAVRSGALFYRYTGDPELRAALRATVKDLLSTRRENGSISCSEVSKQPDGPMGDLWERKYVLLGLDEYYTHVERDPAVLQGMKDVADATLAQIGAPPKVRIVDQGWSPNHIESSTILEPMLRLYRHTGDRRYLDFARYIIVEEGGAKGYRIIDDALANKDPHLIGGPYPKAYEMMSLFEGVLDYYRLTGEERWKTATLNLFNKIRRQEITIIGNGGGDQPYFPAVWGEAWDMTAYEQTNPKLDRQMETCVGVTWLKLCSQLAWLTGDSAAVDEIERYAYNGLIGAMKPGGDGFSYVNRLNGIKTDPKGWGGTINDVYVTCCNLNGPMGLAFLPYIAVMQSAEGPVLNLYNDAEVRFTTPKGQKGNLRIATDYPMSGEVRISMTLPKPEQFTLRLRIPGWSADTRLLVGKKQSAAVAGTYAELKRKWTSKDQVRLELDMRGRVVQALRGSSPGSDRFQAVVRGPVVLARDENTDPHYNQPISLTATNGYIHLSPVTGDAAAGARLRFTAPTARGPITLVDYASVNNWNGKHVCTWLPMEESGKTGGTGE